MRGMNLGRAGRYFAGISLLAFLAFTENGAWGASRDVLWDTVSACLDITALDYCSVCGVPRVEKSCPGGKGCEGTLEVWAESNNYVAVRDRKMCGCPEGYVHGLVIPRAKVTGVEDPRRPAGIWSFGWEVGRGRIADEFSLALAANPPSHRSQDQLHVHIVRLKKEARAKVRAFPQARVGCLDEVWQAAREKAAAVAIKEYGVLVLKHPEGGFLVVLDPVNPEHDFTQARCR